MTLRLLFVGWLALPANAATCDNLKALALQKTTITSAKIVAAGEFRLPPGGPRASVEFFTAFDRLPAFCRVEALATPSPDSHISIEVWLPASGWNGKYLGAGNGGFGGSISYFRLGEALDGGYAAASTDTGHRGTSADREWAAGHPEKQADFDYRAVHEMTALAKAAIRSFYGKAPDRSYFNGCSNGGRQGLMEAERYPADYDGIVAGAPAIDYGFQTFLSADLARFRGRGGKLVIYHGGADDPQPTVKYYRRLKSVDRFVRLYIVPGMGHCGSGPVPNDIGQWLRPGADPQHSVFKALERWVEEGVAPRDIIATQYKRDGDPASGVLRTRRLSPYP